MGGLLLTEVSIDVSEPVVYIVHVCIQQQSACLATV